MVEHLLIALVVLLVAAKLGGALAESLGQPAVLGELLAGVGVGALPLVGVGQLSFLGSDPVVEALADLGVILLLFEVGLSTRLADLMKVGWSALLVATVGVVAPMVLGYFVGVWLLPGSHFYVHLFLGATLSATSVGITARVLQDMGKVKTSEGQIILGAAVIDDVMGLLVLAVMVGLLGGKGTSTGVTAAIVTAKAVGFIVGAKLSPCAVGTTPCVWRSKSLTPSISSRPAMALVTAGCVRCTAAAALWKLRCSSTATKTRSSLIFRCRGNRWIRLSAGMAVSEGGLDRGRANSDAGASAK
jgi:predicted Kef-type K+ transport protein